MHKRKVLRLIEVKKHFWSLEIKKLLVLPTFIVELKAKLLLEISENLECVSSLIKIHGLPEIYPSTARVRGAQFKIS